MISLTPPMSMVRPSIWERVTGRNCLTLRTSIIGHEIATRFGLLEWFLAQTECKGIAAPFFPACQRSSLRVLSAIWLSRIRI